MLEPLRKKIGINSYRRPPSDNLMKPDGRLTNWEAPDNGTNKQMVDGTDNWITERDKQADNFMKFDQMFRLGSRYRHT